MKKNLFIFTFLLGVFSLSAQAQKQEKTITVEVQNNWNQAKADAPVVIKLHELHAGFSAISVSRRAGQKSQCCGNLRLPVQQQPQIGRAHV